MRLVDIVGVRGLLATRNRAEIEALDVERVASGYLRAVEDDRPDAACRRVSGGYFLAAFENYAEYSGHEILPSCFQHLWPLPALTPGARRNSLPKFTNSLCSHRKLVPQLTSAAAVKSGKSRSEQMFAFLTSPGAARLHRQRARAAVARRGAQPGRPAPPHRSVDGAGRLPAMKMTGISARLLHRLRRRRTIGEDHVRRQSQHARRRIVSNGRRPIPIENRSE